MRSQPVVRIIVLFLLVSGQAVSDCPERLGSWPTGATGIAADVVVSDGLAYVVDGPFLGRLSGLRVIDVNDPASPIEVGSMVTQGYALGVAYDGGYVYVADHIEGLAVIDVRDPSSPTQVASHLTVDSALGVDVSDGYAYIADFNRMIVFDVRDPATPIRTGYVNLGAYAEAESVVVSGDYAYVGLVNPDYTGLKVIDVSSPDLPREVGSFDTPDGVHDVAIDGTYTYLAAASAGLRIIDVSSPSGPFEVGSFELPGHVSTVVVADGYAYVGGDEGLWVLDVRSPSFPIGVGFHQTTGSATGVAISGLEVTIAEGRSGLEVVDVSSCPGAPPLLASPRRATGRMRP